MAKLIRKTGRKYTSETKKYKAQFAIYECECGHVWEAQINNMKHSPNGLCRECSLKTHGMSKNPSYKVWKTMRQRCQNPKNQKYEYYGGRGIAVHDSFEDFMTYFNYISKLEHFREPGYSIDRIDNDGDYEPGNLRWATKKEQCLNQRRTK